MLPRRRNVGVPERTPLIEEDLLSYNKLDKKGSSYFGSSLGNFQNYSEAAIKTEEKEIVFDFLEDFVFEPVMAARDRTNEFMATVRSLQNRTQAKPLIRDRRKAEVLETYSQFMNSAKVISKNITSTYAKLEKLALCK